MCPNAPTARGPFSCGAFHAGPVIATVANWPCVAMPDCTLETMLMLFCKLVFGSAIDQQPFITAGPAASGFLGWLNC